MGREHVKMYTPQEFAEYMRVGVNTVYRWLGDGKIPGAIQIGKVWRIPSTELWRMYKAEEKGKVF